MQGDLSTKSYSNTLLLKWNDILSTPFLTEHCTAKETAFINFVQLHLKYKGIFPFLRPSFDNHWLVLEWFHYRNAIQWNWEMMMISVEENGENTGNVWKTFIVLKMKHLKQSLVWINVQIKHSQMDSLAYTAHHWSSTLKAPSLSLVVWIIISILFSSKSRLNFQNMKCKSGPLIAPLKLPALRAREMEGRRERELGNQLS